MSRHHHRWAEVGRVFVPPTYGAKVKGVADEMIEQMCFGVTSIELRCECGDVGERRLLGNHLARIKGCA